MDERLKYYCFLAAPLVWMAVIFYFSGVHNLEFQGELSAYDYVLRKIAHVAEYAILAILLRLSMGAKQTFTVGILYAMSDELHQYYVPTRSGRPSDVLIDAMGLVVGLLVYRWLVQTAVAKKSS